jgi:hypothetical protein
MRLYCFRRLIKRSTQLRSKVQPPIESSSLLLVTPFWDDRSSATKGAIVAEFHHCCKLYLPLDTDCGVMVYPVAGLSFPPLTNAPNATVSCRSPGVRTKCICVPKHKRFYVYFSAQATNATSGSLHLWFPLLHQMHADGRELL